MPLTPATLLSDQSAVRQGGTMNENLSRYLCCSRCGWLTFRSMDKRQAIAMSKIDPSICGRCVRHRFEEEGAKMQESWRRQTAESDRRRLLAVCR